VNLDLEDTQSIHPRNKARQRRLSGSADTDEQQMTLRLTEDTVNTQDVVENFVKQNKRNIQLLFVEHLNAQMDHFLCKVLVTSELMYGLFVHPGKLAKLTNY